MMSTQRNTHDEKITASEVGRQLRCSADTVRRYARAGKLPATLTPLGRLFDPADVARLVAQRTADADRLTAA